MNNLIEFFKLAGNAIAVTAIFAIIVGIISKISEHVVQKRDPRSSSNKVKNHIAKEEASCKPSMKWYKFLTLFFRHGMTVSLIAAIVCIILALRNTDNFWCGTFFLSAGYLIYCIIAFNKIEDKLKAYDYTATKHMFIWLTVSYVSICFILASKTEHNFVGDFFINIIAYIALYFIVLIANDTYFFKRKLFINELQDSLSYKNAHNK